MEYWQRKGLLPYEKDGAFCNLSKGKLKQETSRRLRYTRIYWLIRIADIIHPNQVWSADITYIRRIEDFYTLWPLLIGLAVMFYPGV